MSRALLKQINSVDNFNFTQNPSRHFNNQTTSIKNSTSFWLSLYTMNTMTTMTTMYEFGQPANQNKYVVK